jgi:hypothetical protein
MPYVDVENRTCPCCKGALHRIGEDVSERLDVVPAQFRVIVVRRPKYVCRACQDVSVPARLIEGGLPTRMCENSARSSVRSPRTGYCTIFLALRSDRSCVGFIGH